LCAASGVAAECRAHDARHDARRSDGLSRLHSRVDAGARRAREAGDGLTHAYSQAPITTVSHAPILTRTFPPLRQVSDFGPPLPDAVPYLPGLLKARGYRTGAFVGSLVLDPREGTAPGFDRGFDVYDAGFRIRRPGENRYTSIERRGRDVVS